MEAFNSDTSDIQQPASAGQGPHRDNMSYEHKDDIIEGVLRKRSTSSIRISDFSEVHNESLGREISDN